MKSHNPFLIAIRQFLKYFTPLLPLQNKVIFDNFGGRGLGDNPKYIALALHKLSPKTQLFWIIDKRMVDKIDMPSYIKPLFVNSAFFYYHLGTARAWVSNFRDPYFQARKKRSGQFYLQTWHGSGPGKKIEKDAESSLDPNYIKLAKKDSEISDLALAGSHLLERIFKESFWYNGNIICCEQPRNDILSNKHIQMNIKKQLGIGDCNLCLYAPTFRKDGNLDVYNVDYSLLKSSLESRFKGKWVIAIRLHPNLADKTSALKLPSSIIDLTLYPDIQELLAATDVLITDFSSCMHDFSTTTKRPVFLFAPDYDDYLKGEREMYLNPKSFPFPLATSNKSLAKQISSFDNKKYQKDLDVFIENSGIFLGTEGAQKAAKILCEQLKKNK